MPTKNIITIDTEMRDYYPILDILQDEVKKAVKAMKNGKRQRTRRAKNCNRTDKCGG